MYPNRVIRVWLLTRINSSISLGITLDLAQIMRIPLIFGSLRVWVTLAIVALLCSSCTQTDFNWADARSAGRYLGIVNDSVMVQSHNRAWSRTKSGLLTEVETIEGSTYPGYTLLNYKRKAPAIFTDTSEDNYDLVGQFQDSVLYGGDLKEDIVLWKIGDREQHIKISSKSRNCSEARRLTYQGVPDFRIRPWLQNKFLVLKNTIDALGDTCQFGILDSATNKLDYSKFSGSQAWLSQCKDIKAVGDKIACLRVLSDTCGIALYVDGREEDRLIVGNCTILSDASLQWFGPYVAFEPMWNYGVEDWRWPGLRLFAVDETRMRFRTDYPERWMFLAQHAFADSLGNKVIYSSEDLN